ncbi:antibiotic biosynthesis monooxygenase family protein [Methylomonas sp. MgM2]
MDFFISHALFYQINRVFKGRVNSHELRRCIESKEHYVLLVRWQSLEAHEHGFRQSPEYQEWKRMLHHFYNPFPTVLHYEVVPGI